MESTTKRRIPFGNILFEAFFVVLGLSLAYFLNDWREQKNNTEHAEKALSYVYEEIKLNQMLLQESMKYHRSLMDTLRYFQMSGDNQTPSISVFREGFTKPAVLSSSAWDATKVTKAINYIDYEKVLDISRIYAQQERYNDQAKLAGSVIYKELFEVGPFGMLKNYRNLLNIISTYYYKENELLNYYSIALEKLPREEGNPGKEGNNNTDD